MSELISEDYRKLNEDLHETRADYGAGKATSKWYPFITNFANDMKAASILDYGCGKGAMAQALSHYVVKCYDPAIPKYDTKPEPSDLVVCLDVMEHIEPENLDAVLDDLKRCTKQANFLTVATRPAVKFLADGRNAHLIQENSDWWLPKLMERWEMRLFQAHQGEFAFFGVSRAALEESAVAA